LSFHFLILQATNSYHLSWDCQPWLTWFLASCMKTHRTDQIIISCQNTKSETSK
jgi:hypothetical protein